VAESPGVRLGDRVMGRVNLMVRISMVSRVTVKVKVSVRG